VIHEEEPVVVAAVVEVFEVEAVAAAEVEEEVVDSIENLKVHPKVWFVRKIITRLSHKYYYLIEIGSYSHPCESQLVCKATNDMIPYFNAGIFLENKQQIGKVDEIFGPMKQYVRNKNRFHSIAIELILSI
jgi:hypothetical protein